MNFTYMNGSGMLTTSPTWVRAWLLSLACFLALGANARANKPWHNEGQLQQQELPETVEFGRDILPILSDKCFTCHGPDSATREGGFRLDQAESAMGEADSGERPIVPGDPDSSELLKRIHATNYERMPPRSQEKQLTDQERALLRTWIEEGARWQQHWAFESLRQQQIPVCRNVDWCLDPLDAFVLQKLERKAWQPAARADRRTLIRRATLDLTGLPPTREELYDFLNDPSDDVVAFEKVVDRLLASPHYGERMATVWLDTARYADTNGYQNDFKRHMWPWRDWVISAYNSNKPYNDFVVEQLAGDLLPGATLDQRIATGFNRNHRSVTEGGSIEQEWLVENVVDRVETTATAFLGLTMGCARCHDHKYDPISQREFYQFFAYFYNVDEKGFHNETRGNVPPLVQVPTPEHTAQLADLESRLESMQQRLQQLDRDLQDRQQEWLAEFIDSPPADESDAEHSDKTLQSNRLALLTPAQIETETFARLADQLTEKRQTDNGAEPLADFDWSVWGPAVQISGREQSHIDLGDAWNFDAEQEFSASVWVKPQSYGAILSRMDAGNDYRGFDLLLTGSGQLNVHLIHRWPGNAIKITSQPSLPRGRWTQVAVTYDGSRSAKGLKIYFNGQSVDFQVNNDSLDGTTLTDHPFWLGYRGYTDRFRGRISQLEIDPRQLASADVVGRFEQQVRALITASAAGPDAESLWQPWLESSGRDLAKIEARWQAERTQTIAELFRDRFSPEYAELQQQVKRIRRERDSLEASQPTTMVMLEREVPRECYVLRRGQYDQPDRKQQVFPGVPQFLPQPPADAPANRLTLARWMVQADNPLTARVAVNRYWQMLMGRGLVATQENFGVQSPRPLQLDLLDYLALEFQESGWDVKAMLKRIITSATYCQSSAVGGKAYQTDPANEWLARGSRGRLPAEHLRDSALALAGLLETRLGGPSIKPYQPEGLWEELAGGAGEGPYVQDTGHNLYRRSLYIYRKRTVPHPTMTTFDAGSREICQVSRPRTNTPLQALALLNDPTYVEAARHFAERCLIATATQTGPERPQQHDMESAQLNLDNALQLAFESATCRTPSADEFKVLQAALARYRLNFQNHPEQAEHLLKIGQSEADQRLEPDVLAAMASVCSLILNLDETITRE